MSPKHLDSMDTPAPKGSESSHQSEFGRGRMMNVIAVVLFILCLLVALALYIYAKSLVN